MHELSICLALVETVQRIARDEEAHAVSRIVLNIGPLSGIEPDLLMNAYPLAAGGTIAADAEVLIERPPVVVQCSECGAESNAAANRLLCATCGGFRTRVVSGDEMILRSLEIERAPPGGKSNRTSVSSTH